jgi:hypothetical protein
MLKSLSASDMDAKLLSQEDLDGKICWLISRSLKPFLYSRNGLSNSEKDRDFLLATVDDPITNLEK